MRWPPSCSCDDDAMSDPHALIDVDRLVARTVELVQIPSVNPFDEPMADGEGEGAPERDRCRPRWRRRGRLPGRAPRHRWCRRVRRSVQRSGPGWANPRTRYLRHEGRTRRIHRGGRCVDRRRRRAGWTPHARGNRRRGAWHGRLGARRCRWPDRRSSHRGRADQPCRLPGAQGPVRIPHPSV